MLRYILLPSNKYDFLFCSIAVVLGIIFWRRIQNQPLHPDTAEFLHPGLIKSLKQKFKPCRSPTLWRWWHDSIFDVAVKFRKRVYGSGTSFPFCMYCDINPRVPYYEGGNPVVQQKMAIYWMYQLYGKFFSRHPNSFRILQTFIISWTAYNVYATIYFLTGPLIALITGALFLFIISYPFLDNGQIHSEIYGAFFLSFFSLLLIMTTFGTHQHETHIFFLVGLFLVLLTIFCKITFASESAIFLIFPFFKSSLEESLLIFLGEATAVICVFLIFAATPYFVQLLRILNPKNILQYREKILTLQTNDKTNIKVTQNESVKSNWFYLHFNTLFNLGLLVFCICGFCFNWVLEHTIINLSNFMLIWAISSLLTLKFQNKFYPAHFLPPLIPILIYWGLTNQKIIYLWQRVDLLYIYEFSMLIFATTVTITLSSIAIWLWLRFVALNSNSSYFILPYHKRRNPHTLQLIAAPVIGNYIKDNSEPSNRIFTFGYANSAYIYAQRRASLDFFEGTLGIDPEIANPLWHNYWKFWVCRDIHKFKPKYLIDMDGRLNVDAINESTGLMYQHEKTFYGCFDIFILKNGNAPARFTGPETVFKLVLDTSERYVCRLAYNKKLFGTQIKDLGVLKGKLGEMIAAWQLSIDGRNK